MRPHEWGTRLKGASYFAQDDTFWEMGGRRIAGAMAHLSDDEAVAKMGHPVRSGTLLLAV